MVKLKAGIIGAGGITDYHINGYIRSGVDIIESCLKPTGAEYRILKSIKLEDKKR